MNLQAVNFRDANICSHVQSHELDHVSGNHHHMCAFSTSGCALGYFTVLYRVQYYSTISQLLLLLQSVIILACSPKWEIDGETVETGSDFIFLGYKITADGDCSHEIKRRLLLVTLPTKVCLVKAMVLPVVMYGCESWTVKKAKR